MRLLGEVRRQVDPSVVHDSEAPPPVPLRLESPPGPAASDSPSARVGTTGRLAARERTIGWTTAVIMTDRPLTGVGGASGQGRLDDFKRWPRELTEEREFARVGDPRAKRRRLNLVHPPRPRDAQPSGSRGHGQVPGGLSTATPRDRCAASPATGDDRSTAGAADHVAVTPPSVSLDCPLPHPSAKEEGRLDELAVSYGGTIAEVRR
jgi:hypothetical protein